MRNSFLITLFVLLLPTLTLGQEMYRTVKGKVAVRGEGADSSIIARSDELVMRVDHERGVLYMNLDQSTLRTGIDSLDSLLERRVNDRIRFEGEMEGGGFDPNYCYSATPFRVDGVLSYNGRKERIRGEGEFRSRVSDDRIPCLLDIRFDMELKDEEWEGFLPGFEKDIQLRILQAVLNPNK